MDKVIYSRILLQCDYDTFCALSKTCKMIYNTAKIMWKYWIQKNLKHGSTMVRQGMSRYPGDPVEYTYYLKPGGRVKHGTYKRSDNRGRITEIKNYSHGKLHGLVVTKEYYGIVIKPMIKKKIVSNYRRGALHGIRMIYNAGKLRSVSYFENGRKCCSIRNDHKHFCHLHREEGMNLMFPSQV